MGSDSGGSFKEIVLSTKNIEINFFRVKPISSLKENKYVLTSIKRSFYEHVNYNIFYVMKNKYYFRWCVLYLVNKFFVRILE